jgi:hypothetical protein
MLTRNKLSKTSLIISRKIKLSKKKLLLRIDPKLHDELRKWAEDDFRSINAQIEFLLKKAVANNRRDSND